MSLLLNTRTFWEISLKHRLGRLRLPDRPDRHVVSRRRWLRLQPPAFDGDSAAHDALLPYHHRDPFDRGLVAILNCTARHRFYGERRRPLGRIHAKE
ncbi:MAG: hypothetical protein OXF98_09465 [Rhodospirillaceae bacterium]|nr:hypothetical protein [Rhodospirillaceae bacterium]